MLEYIEDVEGTRVGGEFKLDEDPGLPDLFAKFVRLGSGCGVRGGGLII
jgi:hypothetical protein